MSTRKNQNIKRTTYWLCITAVFMALNVAMSSFSIPVPGGHLFLQAGVGAIVGMILCWKCKLVELFNKKGLLR